MSDLHKIENYIKHLVQENYDNIPYSISCYMIKRPGAGYKQVYIPDISNNHKIYIKHFGSTYRFKICTNNIPRLINSYWENN